MDNPFDPKPAPPYKTPIWKTVLFAVPAALGLLFLIASPFVGDLRSSIAFVLMGLSFALPGAWFFLHERKSKAGQPMKRHWVAVMGTSLALLVGGATAMPTPEEDPNPGPQTLVDLPKTSAAPTPTSTSTPTPTSALTASPSTTTSSTSSMTVIDSVAPTTNKAPASEQPIGFTEAPGHGVPRPLEKTVQSCGDIAIHETGTTFFTDGTSGWTQQCSETMLAQRPPAAPPAPTAPAPPAPGIDGVKPGAFCSKSQIGQSATGTSGGTYTCTSDGSGTPHWR